MNHHVAVGMRYHAAMVGDFRRRPASRDRPSPKACTSKPWPIRIVARLRTFQDRVDAIDRSAARSHLDVERRTAHQPAGSPSRSIACASSVTVDALARPRQGRCFSVRQTEDLRRQRAPQSTSIDGVATSRPARVLPCRRSAMPARRAMAHHRPSPRHRSSAATSADVKHGRAASCTSTQSSAAA
jgi:hypothetical protein